MNIKKSRYTNRYRMTVWPSAMLNPLFGAFFMRILHNPTCIPVMPYFGGKTLHASWVNSFLPKSADAYIEGFAGSAAVGLSRPNAHLDVYNDFDAGVANLYDVIKTQPDELCLRLRFTLHSRQEHALCSTEDSERAHGKIVDRVEWARQHLVLVRQSFVGGFDGSWAYSRQSRSVSFARVVDLIPPVTNHLQNAVIENLHFKDLFAKYKHLGINALWYLDPPYIPETRVSKKVYRHEMTLDEHKLLLDMITKITGMVVLSGYPSHLYNEALVGWMTATKNVACLASATGGKHKARRTECLWINPAAQERLRREQRLVA